MGSAMWIVSFITIAILNVLLVKSQYTGWYGSQQAYPGYSSPIVVSADGDDGLKCILPILLLLLLDNIGGNGGNRGCGGCGCGCCCGGNNGNSIPIPYPIPIPVNNPIIT